MSIRVLRAGDRGPEVARWQLFLLGQGIEVGAADGIFGRRTGEGTAAFQKAHGLPADGVVGLRTWGQAMVLGIEVIDDPEAGGGESDPSFPPPPGFAPLLGIAARQRVFGAFRYEPSPVPANPEQIRILDAWAEQNILATRVPELEGIPGAPPGGVVPFHRLAQKQLIDLFAAIKAAGLLSRVLHWDGSFVPRFVRGSRTTLSNHAFGSAFDINARENPLAAQPALVGQRGSVRELVQIANDHGFYWGGHFGMRRDGNHFEVARVLGRGQDADEGDVPETGIPGLLALPPAPAKPITGSAFLAQTKDLSRPDREKAIERAILDGNVPSFLREMAEIVIPPLDGATLMPITVYVARDYLAIGTDQDFVRIPMSPLTAQRIADAAGCALPTKKLVDVIWARAGLKLSPEPLPAGPAMLTNDYFGRHQALVEAQRAGRPVQGIVAGHKKDVVISSRLATRPDRVAIYGWHRPDGRPIQPLSTIHENTYADYSHGARLIAARAVVDGMEMRLADVLSDDVLSTLLSDEGPLASARVPGV